jgi:hypothetical protein
VLTRRTSRSGASTSWVPSSTSATSSPTRRSSGAGPRASYRRSGRPGASRFVGTTIPTCSRTPIRAGPPA